MVAIRVQEWAYAYAVVRQTSLHGVIKVRVGFGVSNCGLWRQAQKISTEGYISCRCKFHNPVLAFLGCQRFTKDSARNEREEAITTSAAVSVGDI